MRRSVLGVDVDVITEEAAIHSLLIAPGEHVPFLGAGISKEAGVPLAWEICNDIRQRLKRSFEEADDEWARTRLNWDDLTRRYSTCLTVYGPTPEDRVNYFRSLLHGIRPSFAHHALALLMSNDQLHRNALTTNFDKLIEQSFMEQNIRECQAIRMPEEAEFWGPESDKCYLLKLHGDYDTHNILNTSEETRSIQDFFVDLSRELLRSRGLLALGSAGNEQSINRFLESLLDSPEKRFLSRGVRWGVYVGSRKPDDLSDSASADVLVAAVEAGALNRHIVEILSYFTSKDRPCLLFPVWGSGGFLLRLIERLGDRTLEYRARLLLDHDMRVAALLRNKGIPPEAIDQHLEQLRSAQLRLNERRMVAESPPRKIADFDLSSSSTNVEIVYSDIANQRLLMDTGEGNARRAVVSADDTMISAGGGVALSLLSEAGAKFLLNELGKLAPIPQGSVVVTSAGSLPVQYIIHAAAMEIDDSGAYSVTVGSVASVVHDTLIKAEALGVEHIFIPLIGTGIAGLSASECLTAILKAVDSSQPTSYRRAITIVIFDEIVLSRDTIMGIVHKWNEKADKLAHEGLVNQEGS